MSVFLKVLLLLIKTLDYYCMSELFAKNYILKLT